MGFNSGFKGLIDFFNNSNFSKLNFTLTDDGDNSETCWSSFNINFNTPFKAILLCISTNIDSTKMHGTTVKKKRFKAVTFQMYPVMKLC